MKNEKERIGLVLVIVLIILLAVAFVVILSISSCEEDDNDENKEQGSRIGDISSIIDVSSNSKSDEALIKSLFEKNGLTEDDSINILYCYDVMACEFGMDIQLASDEINTRTYFFGHFAIDNTDEISICSYDTTYRFDSGKKLNDIETYASGYGCILVNEELELETDDNGRPYTPFLLLNWDSEAREWQDGVAAAPFIDDDGNVKLAEYMSMARLSEDDNFYTVSVTAEYDVLENNLLKLFLAVTQLLDLNTFGLLIDEDTEITITYIFNKNSEKLQSYRIEVDKEKVADYYKNNSDKNNISCKNCSFYVDNIDTDGIEVNLPKDYEYSIDEIVDAVENKMNDNIIKSGESKDLNTIDNIYSNVMSVLSEEEIIVEVSDYIQSMEKTSIILKLNDILSGKTELDKLESVLKEELKRYEIELVAKCNEGCDIYIKVDCSSWNYAVSVYAGKSASHVSKCERTVDQDGNYRKMIIESNY